MPRQTALLLTANLCQFFIIYRPKTICAELSPHNGLTDCLWRKIFGVFIFDVFQFSVNLEAA